MRIILIRRQRACLQLIRRQEEEVRRGGGVAAAGRAWEAAGPKTRSKEKAYFSPAACSSSPLPSVPGGKSQAAPPPSAVVAGRTRQNTLMFPFSSCGSNTDST